MELKLKQIKSFLSDYGKYFFILTLSLFAFALAYSAYSYYCDQYESKLRKTFYLFEKELSEKTKDLKAKKDFSDFFKKEKKLFEKYESFLLKNKNSIQAKEFVLNFSSFLPEKTLGSFLNVQKDKKDLMSSLVFLKMASLDFEKNNYEKARKNFLLASKNSHVQKTALFKLIVLSLKFKKFDEAEKYLREMELNEPSSSMNEKARKLILFYKAQSQ